MPRRALVIIGTMHSAWRLACFALLLAAPWACSAEVAIRGEAILVEGRPFRIQGASGRTQLDMLKALGANTVRTYGDETEQVLREAARLDLKVIAGLWLEPPRRGFDYRNRIAVEAQLKAIAALVERHRSHPALLMWGIGNEVEAELTDDALVWPAIGEAARLVKSLDRAHPTMAVLAETGGDKVRKLRERAPSIDVLGVNAYGDALLTVPDRVRAQGWTGPIVVSELGALGQWQAGKTAWGALLEPSSTAKAAALRRYFSGGRAQDSGTLGFPMGLQAGSDADLAQLAAAERGMDRSRRGDGASVERADAGGQSRAAHYAHRPGSCGGVAAIPIRACNPRCA